MVRITDRKPKWVVNGEREKASLSKNENAKQEPVTPTPEPTSTTHTTTPSKPVISKTDMDVSRRRDPVSFFGSIVEMR